MEITLFNFNGAELRCITKESEPWFVAADVCKVLEISNITEALRSLDADDLTSVILNSGGQNREMKIINESGLYNLAFKSRTSKAKQFKKWVTSEVLPAIRKTGAYSVTKPLSRLEMAQLLLEAETRSVELETKLLAAEPKVEFFDTVTKSNTVVTMAVAAQTAKLPFGQNILYRKLREMGVLISAGSRYNLPKQQYIEQGLFTVNEHKFNRTNGEVDVNFTTHVTQKGIAWISSKLKGAA